jgi:putative phosphoribosyl transferase
MKASDRYRDRREAGKILATHLLSEDLGIEPIVLALPRGGVPVGAEVAEALNAPLDVFVVRKLGFPDHPELAMGAIASGGVPLLDRQMISAAGLSEAGVEKVIHEERRELRRREQAYRSGSDQKFYSRPVIVVDDGLATGFTMRAAVAALRQTGSPRITVAVPVAARSTCVELAREVDRLICPLQPEHFHAVGAWYEDFSATTDDEVRDCVARLARPRPAVNPPGGIA